MGGTGQLKVTVSAAGHPALAERARAKAAEWGVEYVERPRKTGRGALVDASARLWLVLGAEGWTLWDGERALRFTPGMATLRIKRLEAGRQDDRLLALAQLRPGDAVLDCTFGLGADALVCAKAVGPEGRVGGVESSFPLWALASEGLAAGPGFSALAPIDLAFGDHLEVLRARARASVDVVLFDPMFGRPQRSAPAFELLRAHADPRPLRPEALAEARRVARRWVLVKAARYSRDLRALGLKPEPGSRFSNLVWARLPP